MDKKTVLSLLDIAAHAIADAQEVIRYPGGAPVRMATNRPLMAPDQIDFYVGPDYNNRPLMAPDQIDFYVGPDYLPAHNDAGSHGN